MICISLYSGCDHNKATICRSREVVEGEKSGGRMWGSPWEGGNKIYFMGILGAGVNTGSVGGRLEGVISECCCQ